MVIAWSHIHSIAITATALSDNFFVNKIKGGVKGLPMSRHKWRKKGKDKIFRQMAGKWEKLKFFAILPFVPAQRQPLDPTSAVIDKNVITGYCCNDSYGKKATPSYYHSLFLYLSENSILGHLSTFVPAFGQPLDPNSAFINKNVITRCSCSDSSRSKAIPGFYHPIFLPSA